MRKGRAPAGLLLIEVGHGREEGGSSDFSESLHWSTIDELLSFLKKQGLECLRKQPIDFPAGGKISSCKRLASFDLSVTPFFSIPRPWALGPASIDSLFPCIDPLGTGTSLFNSRKELFSPKTALALACLWNFFLISRFFRAAHFFLDTQYIVLDNVYRYNI